MREDKFRVIQFIRDMIVVVDKELDIFSNKDTEIKNRIRMNNYDLLEIAYEANSARDKEYKIELISKLIAHIKILDFLLDLSCDKKLITEKRFSKLEQRLDDIIKFAMGWMKKLKENKLTKQLDALEVKVGRNT